MIFVFGSNRAGRHGAGAAAHAAQHLEAEYGVGEGLTGRCYALPTMDERINPLNSHQIKLHVDKFIACAKNNPDMEFQVTRVGCGLGGKMDKDIAPMFLAAPKNCHFDFAWKPFLGKERYYWGHV